MRFLVKALLLFQLFIFTNCNKEKEVNPTINTIEIGNYVFIFPEGFTLNEGQGIDSYVGEIVKSEISISFDYGWYTSASQNLPEDEYLVVEDEISGHFRQIVKPIDSQLNFTKIHLYKISDSIESPFGYNSLTMLVNNIPLAEQELILSIYETGEEIQ